MVRSKYLYFLATAVLVLGIAITAFVGLMVKTGNDESLLRRAGTVAQLIDPKTTENLKGSKEDLANPSYQKLKLMLQNVREVNSDVRFIYLMGMRSGEIFFFVDSEPADSPDYSPPGQSYPEASQGFREVFSSGRSLIENIYTDRWGTWVSASSPIINPQNKKVLAVVGMDISAYDYIMKIIVYSALPLLVTILILVLIGIYSFIRKKEKSELALKAEFVSIAAHEIRSPLTGIAWGVEGAISELTDRISESELATLQNVKQNCDKLLKTTNELLDLYSLEKSVSQKEEIDICSLLEGLAGSFKMAANARKIDILFKSGVKSASVSGDKNKLRRMFSNLISNAIKYSKIGGRVTISCEEKEKTYLFIVSDEGIGVPSNEQKKIFQGFYRASNAREAISGGTGLGLYYVKQIAESHGGKIWLESKENEGASFFVEFKKA